MSESIGYEKDACQVRVSPKCQKKNAGYERRPQFAQQGEWLPACEPCARVPYEQPAQFQDGNNRPWPGGGIESFSEGEEDPSNGF